MCADYAKTHVAHDFWGCQAKGKTMEYYTAILTLIAFIVLDLLLVTLNIGYLSKAVKELYKNKD